VRKLTEQFFLSKVKLDNFPVFRNERQEKSIFSEFIFQNTDYPYLAFKFIFFIKNVIIEIEINI
jgi:hypothetical protein